MTHDTATIDSMQAIVKEEIESRKRPDQFEQIHVPGRLRGYSCGYVEYPRPPRSMLRSISY